MKRAIFLFAAFGLLPILASCGDGVGGSAPEDPPLAAVPTFDNDDVVVVDIADLRADGAEVVVVQLLSWFQFSEVKSELVERAAHRAIDEGADVVIAHHPHVLQDFEW